MVGRNCKEMFAAAEEGDLAFIRKGMGEGKVVLKIGKPDHEAFQRVVRANLKSRAGLAFPTRGTLRP